SVEEDRTASGPVGLLVVPLESTGGSTSVGVGTPYIVRQMLNDEDMPDELKMELLRSGFIELDAPGRKGPARYISTAISSSNSVRTSSGSRPTNEKRRGVGVASESTTVISPLPLNFRRNSDSLRRTLGGRNVHTI